MEFWLKRLLFAVTDDNSDSESEAEERAKGRLKPFLSSSFYIFWHLQPLTTLCLTFLPFLAHRQRLVSVQSILSQPSQAQVHYNGTSSSLEQELHQRQLFEYFLVVSLQRSKAGAHYLPEVTQQFPPKVRIRGGLKYLFSFCGNFVLEGQYNTLFLISYFTH